jgi:tRNA/rRNA methyltransferase
VPNLRIILVEPKEAGNVGATARVMKNFGFRQLWIVGQHPPLHPLAGWWASGADDVVAATHFAPTLHAAIADVQLAVATTSARGRTTPVDLLPPQLSKTFAALGTDETLALVFGREDSGLTREEVMQCQRTAGITTDPEFPTMNLAQAVGVFCYQLSLWSAGAPAGERRRGRRRPTERPDAGSLERLHERAEALLLEIGFLQANNPDRIYDQSPAAPISTPARPPSSSASSGRWSGRFAISEGHASRRDSPRSFR